MCSISGSLNKAQLVELCRLNEYRGQLCHSITYFDTKEMKITRVFKSPGPVDYNMIDIPKDHYCIVHMQAPTSGQNIVSHPAINEDHYLWHNGILKQNTIEYLQKLYGLKDVKWDTELLLYHLKKNIFPDDVDGSFACLYSMSSCNLILFRNQISPLYIDKDLNVSSTEFVGSKMIEHGKMFAMDFKGKQIYYLAPFREVQGPYYFGE